MEVFSLESVLFFLFSLVLVSKQVVLNIPKQAIDSRDQENVFQFVSACPQTTRRLRPVSVSELLPSHY